MEVCLPRLRPICFCQVMTWLLGYLLGIVIDAVTQFQSRSEHKDPLHATAHFLRPVSVGAVEIHVKCLRTGHWLTNLTAELVQGVRLVIHGFHVYMLTW